MSFSNALNGNRSNQFQARKTDFQRDNAQEREIENLINIAGIKGFGDEAYEQVNKDRDKEGFLSKTLNVLLTSEYAVGGLLSGKGMIEGIKQRISPSEALGISKNHKSFKQALKDPSTYLGFAVDVLLDPITYMTFGAGTGAKLATKTGTKVLNKKGMKLLAETTARLAVKNSPEVAFAGARRIVAREMLTEKGAKELIDQGGLKFFGETMMKGATMKKPFSKMGNGLVNFQKKLDLADLKDPIAKALVRTEQAFVDGIGRTVSNFQEAFKPFHKIKSTLNDVGDVYVDSFNKLQKGTRAQADDLVRRIAGMKKDTAKLQKLVGDANIEDVIADALQTGKMTGIREVDQVIKGLKDFNKAFRNAEVGRKMKVGKVQEYLARYLTKDGRAYVERGGDIMATIPRPLRAKLGASKSRKMFKFVNTKTGEEKVGALGQFGEKFIRKDEIKKIQKATEEFAKKTNIKKSAINKKISQLADKINLVFKTRASSDVEKLLKEIGVDARNIREIVRVFRDKINKVDINELQKKFKESQKIKNITKSMSDEDALRVIESAKKLFSKTSQDTEAFNILLKKITVEIKNKKTKKVAKKIADSDVAKSAREMVDEINSLRKIAIKNTVNDNAVNEFLTQFTKQFQKNPEGARSFLKSIGVREKRISDLSHELSKVVKIADEEMAKLPTSDVFIKGGDDYFEVVQATIKDINEVMEPVLRANTGRRGLKFFETDPFKAVAARGIDSLKATQTIDFLNEVGKNFGRVGRLDGSGKVVSETIGNMKYVESTAPQLKGMIFPAPIVEHLDKTFEFMSNDKVTSEFLRTYDQILGFWKGTVTGLFPAFHSRNFIGGVFNNWLGGVYDPKLYKVADEIARGKAGHIVTKLGQKIDYADIRKMHKQLGIKHQPGIMDVMKDIDDISAIGAGPLSKAKDVPLLFMNMVEDRIRIPMFVDRMVKGYTPEMAAKEVFKFHFDYATEGLTFFERNVMRRLIPFYRWTRGNIPLQIEQMIKQPGKYAGMKKLIDNIEDTDKRRIEAEHLPDYMRESMPIRIGEKQGFGQYLYGMGLPAEDINKLWRGDLKRTMEGILGEMSPLLKFPLEKATGQNLFFGTKIKDQYRAPKFLKSLPEGIQEWLELREVPTSTGGKRLIADPEKLHMLQAVLSRGWTTFDKLGSDNTATSVKVLYTLVGLKSRAVDMEQQKYFRDRDRLQALQDYFQMMGEGRIYRNFYLTKEQREALPKELQQEYSDVQKLKRGD